MTYVCKNWCTTEGFESAGVAFAARQRYDKTDNKYCVECCFFCSTKLLTCPCCGRRFRTRRKKKSLNAGRAKK